MMRALQCLLAAALCGIGATGGAIGADAAVAPVTIKLIAFNDFHGAINPPASPTLTEIDLTVDPSSGDAVSAAARQRAVVNDEAPNPLASRYPTLTKDGEQLRLLLEEQWTRANTVLQVSDGFTYTWDAAAPLGARVDTASMRLHGVPIDRRASYRVTVNEFLAAGGNGFSALTKGLEPRRGILDVEALEHYFGEHSPLGAPATNRITRRH